MSGLFKKRMEFLFLVAMAAGLFYLAVNYLEAYRFKNAPLPAGMQERIDNKQREIEALIEEKYHLSFHVPIIVTDEINSHIFGLASQDEQHKIRIFLNKKRLRESLPYVLESVMPHEYAHALVFFFGKYDGGDGHSAKWQQICIDLQGKGCDRYVDHVDVVSGKLF